MKLIRTILFASVFLLPLLSKGQSVVNGRTLSNDSVILAGVSIYNRHSQLATTSDPNGDFSLTVRTGDTILFSGVNVIARYWIVPANASRSVHTILLRDRVVNLAAISIKSSTYKQDSLANRQEYAAAFNFHRPRFREIVAIQPVGIGVNINKLTHAMAIKSNRHKMFFKQQLITYEREGFVNAHYNADVVSSQVPLRGDTLTYFVDHYRPSYELVHDYSQYDLLYFIHHYYKQFCDSLQRVTDSSTLPH